MKADISTLHKPDILTLRRHRYLKWLTWALFAYILTAFVVRVPWTQAFRSTLVPSVFSGSGISDGVDRRARHHD